MNKPPASIESFIDKLVLSTGSDSPEEAIRAKARELIQTYRDMFGDPEMPIDVGVLTGLNGIHVSDDLPVQSPDAELVPRSEGGVEMRVHPDRPETRKRFSIAHEISHTFFPEYEKQSWCRTDARYRDRADPEQYLEMLCDIGAAELLFPEAWFRDDASRVECAQQLVELADKYAASREATLRRFAETSNEPVAAVFFTWKLKPSQKGDVGNDAQGGLFGIDSSERIRDAIELRIDYSIPSQKFAELGHYLPPNKSIKQAGPIFDTSSSAICHDGECDLDLGAASGTYAVMSIPLPTKFDDRGPNDAYNVAALIRPVAVAPPVKKKREMARNKTPSMFD